MHARLPVAGTVLDLYTSIIRGYGNTGITLRGGDRSSAGNGGSIGMEGGLPIDGNGGSIDLIGNSGVGTNKSGGYFAAQAGNSTGSGTPGAVQFLAGSSTGSADGGIIEFFSGGGGTSGKGGYILIDAGSGGSSSGDGGPVDISGGDSPNGDAGDVTISGGTPSNGAGGDIALVATAGVGTNKNGGNVSITAGQNTGSGTKGAITFTTNATEAARFAGSGHFIVPEFSTDPGTGDLSADAAVAIYTKNDKFVIAYNNGGTMTYIKIPLDGSTTTWTHDTTAP